MPCSHTYAVGENHTCPYSDGYREGYEAAEQRAERLEQLAEQCDKCGEPFEGDAFCERCVEERAKAAEQRVEYLETGWAGSLFDEWRRRALAAEQRAERLREALVEITDGFSAMLIRGEPFIRFEKVVTMGRAEEIAVLAADSAGGE